MHHCHQYVFVFVVCSASIRYRLRNCFCHCMWIEPSFRCELCSRFLMRMDLLWCGNAVPVFIFENVLWQFWTRFVIQFNTKVLKCHPKFLERKSTFVFGADVFCYLNILLLEIRNDDVNLSSRQKDINNHIWNNFHGMYFACCVFLPHLFFILRSTSSSLVSDSSSLQFHKFITS